MKISSDEQSMIWNLIAVVIHLGRVEFKAAGDHCVIANPDAVQV
jgi:hypothetical protein